MPFEKKEGGRKCEVVRPSVAVKPVAIRGSRRVRCLWRRGPEAAGRASLVEVVVRD